MLETISQQSFQPEYFTPNHQQPGLNYCRHSSSPFQHRTHTPVSPSPLGARNANANANANANTQPVMNECGNKPTDQENLLSSPCNRSERGDSSNSMFSFQTNNYSSVTPPQKYSTFEERFRRSGGSSNPFTKIFGSSPSSNSSNNTSTSSSSKHRQLFFNRIKQNRDDTRFNSRGESLVMMECHSEQQTWDERMRRKADTLSHQYQFEEEEIPDENENSTGYENDEEMMLEEFLTQEQELDMDMDTLSSRDHVQSPNNNIRSNRSSLYDDTDDTDYDDIFMELVDNNNKHHVSLDTTMSL